MRRRRKLGEAENFSKQGFHEGFRRRRRGRGEFGVIAELGLADTKIARDLVAQGQALGDAVARVVLPGGIGGGDFESIAGAIRPPSIASESNAGALERGRRAMSEPRR